MTDVLVSVSAPTMPEPTTTISSTPANGSLAAPAAEPLPDDGACASATPAKPIENDPTRS